MLTLQSTDAFSGLETVEALNSAQNDQRARTWILTFIHRLSAQTAPHAVARRKVELFWNSRGLRHKMNCNDRREAIPRRRSRCV